MTKENLYQYLGTNGSILSPVFLENIYYVQKLRLIADEGNVLTKDGKKFVSSVVIPLAEEKQWQEVPVGQI